MELTFDQLGGEEIIWYRLDTLEAGKGTLFHLLNDARSVLENNATGHPGITLFQRNTLMAHGTPDIDK